MKHLAARLRFALAYPDWLPLAGGLLALLALALHGVMLPDRQAAIDATEQRLALLEKQLRRQVIDERQGAQPENVRLGIVEHFAQAGRLPADLEKLHALAADAGLTTERADYRLTAGKDALFQRYELSLPVRGAYRNVREFLAALRSSYPNLAIEEVSLRREQIGATEVDAQLRVAFYLRQRAGL